MADLNQPQNPTPNAQPPRENARIYRGEAENQRDPRAQHQPMRKIAPRAPHRPQIRVPSELPPPSLKSKNEGGVISTSNPADATLFAENMSVKENTPRVFFTPSAPALIDISVQTYSELVTDDSNLAKAILPEYLSYYSTAMMWFRMVTLKERTSQPLTQLEQDLLLLIQTCSFVLPEPILLQIRAIGTVVTSTKQHLIPEFPPMPAEVIQQQGGYYDNLAVPGPNTDNARHNLYEEIPCLGVLAYAVRQSVSNTNAGPYQSTITYDGYRRNEAKNLAASVGITDATFPSYPNNLAVNLDFLMSISNILANTKTFKNTSVVLSTLSEIGAQSQTIIERPILANNDRTPGVRCEFRPTSLSKDAECIFGAGIFFSQQLMKESLAADHSSWSMFANIPPEWIANYNQRRNLPVQYMQDVFSALSQRAASYRLNIVTFISVISHFRL
ncbi:hypothetical protein ABEB36_010676 [Hypothenemus hampei]|uniref:Capsid protein n=1 Tax=Hypothenemus hampei TaxID=57062 RepID=A0ABD1EFH0_HYPHA